MSILAAAALAAVVVWRTASSDRTYDAAVHGEVLVSADGRTITAAVGWTGCESLPRLIAHESAQGITLALRREDDATADTACDGGNSKQVSTSLSDPIGARSLTDAVSGRPIAFFDGHRLASPHYLPAGYAPTDDTPSNTTGLAAPATPRTWTRTYQDGVRHDDLTITQSAAPNPDTTGTPVTVNGHPAYLQEQPSPDNPTFRSLTWSDGDNAFTLAMRTPSGPMSKDEFMRVAAGLGY
ncbi:hypothetical protein [Kitasatospora sp. NPDC056531]|uniref:hypothetical protein n=1 Tax=Kitasatospora sp. NPDC056531 TaxID=3345856 RepID=UPI00367419A2